MKLLVAIGGGNWQMQKTRKIDEEIIRLSGKEHPKVLFFPTALHDDQGYAKRFKQYYRSLGCHVDAIRLFHTKKTQEELKVEWKQYDVMYLGGGDSELLMDTLKAKGIDQLLREAYHHGVIIVGYSAGANALFRYGYAKQNVGYTFVEGMDLIHGVFSPHVQDRPQFKDEAKQWNLPCVGCKDEQAYFYMDEEGYFI